MPHATTFRFTAKPGERENVLALFKQWEAERAPVVTGFLRGTVSTSIDNPDEFQAGIMFDTTENYNANSDAPEMGEWFQELRALLVGDPEWFNGNVEIQMNPSA